MISVRTLWRDSRGLCWYCEHLTWLPGDLHTIRLIRLELTAQPGSPFSDKKLRRRQATREHLTRRADGGSDRPWNLVLACHHCNTTRGTRSPQEHRLTQRERFPLGAPSTRTVRCLEETQGGW